MLEQNIMIINIKIYIQIKQNIISFQQKQFGSEITKFKWTQQLCLIHTIACIK